MKNNYSTIAFTIMKNIIQYRIGLFASPILFLCLQISPLFGQTMDRFVIAAAGTHLSTPAGAITFTLGEPVAQSLSNEVELTQGFHQEWAIVTAIDPITTNEFAIHVYPNPTIDLLNIQSDAKGKFSLFDLSGKIIFTDQISSGLNTIVFPNIPAGVYVLVCMADTGERHSFKLEKL